MKNINWWMIAFCIGLVLYGMREGCACVKNKGGAQTGAKEVVYLPGKETIIIDTHYVPQVKQGVPKVVTKVVEIDHFKTDTVEVPVILEVSGETAFYRDSLPVDHGYALITDTISDNRIKGRRFSLRQSLPIIKETTVVPAKPRNVLYAGISAAGGKENYLYKVGGDISLLTKGGKMFGLGMSVTVDNRLLVEAAGRFPIRFRKR